MDHREEIKRSVTNLPDGVSTVTEADNPDIAAAIQKHVAAMARRVEEGRPIRMRDPLFAAVFRNATKININYKTTDKGIEVKETSDEPAVASLIRAHAEVVSLFLKSGYSELRANHEVPKGAEGAVAASDADRAGPPYGFGRGRGAGRGQGRGPGAGPGYGWGRRQGAER